jgi:hypothetical protein
MLLNPLPGELPVAHPGHVITKPDAKQCDKDEHTAEAETQPAAEYQQRAESVTHRITSL